VLAATLYQVRVYPWGFCIVMHIGHDYNTLQTHIIITDATAGGGVPDSVRQPSVVQEAGNDVV